MFESRLVARMLLKRVVISIYSTYTKPIVLGYFPQPPVEVFNTLVGITSK